jgi:hypothetical protein
MDFFKDIGELNTKKPHNFIEDAWHNKETSDEKN